ncbi:MAG TPA: hydrogenase maturation protease [Solirubrobacterales bacterium]|nr:hydrogenase maturation protease [Solirubrobacterales bacterium]
MSSTSSAAVVIGIGNSWAGDDAAGVLVARALRGNLPEGVALVEHEGEPTALIDAWAGKKLAVVVDATRGGTPPGTLRCFDASSAPLPAAYAGASTHAFTLAQAIELARGVGRLPPRLLVLGIEGAVFEAGAEPLPAVAGAIEPAARKVVDLVRTYY